MRKGLDLSKPLFMWRAGQDESMGTGSRRSRSSLNVFVRPKVVLKLRGSSLQFERGDRLLNELVIRDGLNAANFGGGGDRRQV